MRLMYARRMRGVRFNGRIGRRTPHVVVLPASDPRVMAAIESAMNRFQGAWRALADR